MSKRSLNINYKESQIIKHSLQRSIRIKKSMNSQFDSEESFDKEIREEEKVLEKVEKFVDEYKEIINK